ncbi:hypothetical protein MANES_08G069621v8 [Manihot esculenta]|uniref:Uncharacterized protein n=1 Tax=Manihot esculenta TaxID=3983 RepID=A0ACB7HBF3_MANES|nr:hypothetical protein MANES_08G069621v8 [Manihot esculenta]
MSVSSGSARYWNGRLKNVNCRCGKRAGIRISESAENPNRPYYFCRDNVCGSFRGWCEPVNQSSTPSSGSINVDEGWKMLEKVIEDIAKMKNDMKKMKEEQRATRNEIANIRGIMCQLRTIYIVLIFIVVGVAMKVI